MSRSRQGSLRVGLVLGHRVDGFGAEVVADAAEQRRSGRLLEVDEEESLWLAHPTDGMPPRTGLPAGHGDLDTAPLACTARAVPTLGCTRSPEVSLA